MNLDPAVWARWVPNLGIGDCQDGIENLCSHLGPVPGSISVDDHRLA